MAKQQVVTLIDDLDGSTATETVEFGLDGSFYEIELNDKNSKKLRDALASYVSHARRAEGRTSVRPARTRAASARTDREQLQQVREWARKNNLDVSDRGRISAKVMDAYNAQH